MWTNVKQFRNIYPLCLKMHLDTVKWQWCIIYYMDFALYCCCLALSLENIHLIVSSCLLPAYHVLALFFILSTAFAFQSRLWAFLILHHNRYSVSSDKGYEERNKLVVMLLPCLFFWWLFFFYFACDRAMFAGNTVFWLDPGKHTDFIAAACLQLSQMGNGNDIYPFSRHMHKTYLTILTLSENAWLLRLSIATEKRTWLSLTCAICWPVGAAYFKLN